MRKTRRGKKWIAAAVVVWAMAYGARVTPKVQQHGWGAAVPRVVLVASLPLLNDDEGSYEAGSLPGVQKQSWLAEFERWALQEVHRDVFFADPGETSLGWFSRRFAFLLARYQYRDKFPDKSSLQGRSFAMVITKLVDRGWCYGFESDWARSMVACEVQLDRPAADGEMVYGSYQFRRFLDGSYLVRVAGMDESFACHPHRGIFWASRGPVDDATSRTKRMQYDYVGDTRPRRVGYARDLGNGVGEVDLAFSVSTNAAGQGEVERWVEVSRHNVTVSVDIDPGVVPVIDQSQQTKDAIESSIQARLTKAYDKDAGEWYPTLRLILPKRTTPPKETPEVLFGGKLSLVVIWELEGNFYPSFIGTMGQYWWKWSKKESEASELAESDLSTEEQRQIQAMLDVRAEKMSGLFEARISRFNRVGKGLQHHGRTPVNYTNKPYRIVARIEPMPLHGGIEYGGFTSKVVFDGPLEFELKQWTIEELQQFIVNGIVPDHAMP
ncbi:MAG: hypothetical protein ACF8MF_12270 [Phycisphaerales bacterium JB052]